MWVQTQVGPKRLGVALGAGGLRGAVHLGVLRSLERHGLAVDALAGSSAGAIVAAFYASGYSVDQMEELMLSLDAKTLYDPNFNWRSLFGLTVNALLGWLRLSDRYSVPFPQGLLQGDAWENWLSQQLGQTTIAEVTMPIAILATDINSGQAVVFSQSTDLAPVTLADQPLALAVRASSAIPGIFCPVDVAGRTLVDGGVKAGVPASLLLGLGMNVILAVDLGAAPRQDQPIDNIYEIISQSLEITQAELTAYQLTNTADLVLRPTTGEVGLRDFDQIPRLIRIGEEAMDQVIPVLQAMLVR